MKINNFQLNKNRIPEHHFFAGITIQGYVFTSNVPYTNITEDSTFGYTFPDGFEICIYHLCDKLQKPYYHFFQKIDKTFKFDIGDVVKIKNKSEFLTCTIFGQKRNYGHDTTYYLHDKNGGIHERPTSEIYT